MFTQTEGGERSQMLFTLTFVMFVVLKELLTA